MGFGVVAAVTIAFGGPTWIMLRLIRKESARTYVLAGMVGGLLWAFFFLYSSAVAWTVERMDRGVRLCKRLRWLGRALILAHRA
jgi:hypothetical protein